MASPAHKQLQDTPTFHDATSAPPPTPSTQPSNHHLLTSAAAAHTLARLLHRLPPNLSLPTRRPAPPATSPTLISLSDGNANPLLLSSCSELGFFQLTDHALSPQLATSAESEARSLFDLTREEKETYFHKSWPLGFGDHDEEDETGESLCLDAKSLNESTQLSLSSLNGLSRGLEKLGLEVIDKLATIMGFVNPFSDDPTRMCSLLWISEGFRGDKTVGSSGGSYPYVVSLQYQIRSHKYFLLTDSGPVSVLPQVDSVMVTIGDIAQVWSNGRLKKVRGIPKACAGDHGDKEKHSPYVTISVLLTLPLDSTVSPLLPISKEDDDNEDGDDAARSPKGKGKEKENRLFKSFLFEDYAWKVYNERLIFKDPLDRYRC